MLPEERAKCDDLRNKILANPRKDRLPSEQEQVLERYFTREKAIQDSAILLPCAGFTDPVCILATALNGFDFKLDSYGAHPRRPENPLAQPIHPLGSP